MIRLNCAVRWGAAMDRCQKFQQRFGLALRMRFETVLNAVSLFVSGLGADSELRWFCTKVEIPIMFRTAVNKILWLTQQPYVFYLTHSRKGN